MRIGISLLLLLQATAAPATYDTRAVTQACDRAASGDDAIVVCGRRDKERYRIPPLPSDDPRFGPAETSIDGARVGLETERGFVGTFPTNRVMLKVRIPL